MGSRGTARIGGRPPNPADYAFVEPMYIGGIPACDTTITLYYNTLAPGERQQVVLTIGKDFTVWSIYPAFDPAVSNR